MIETKGVVHFLGRQFYFHGPDRNVLEIGEWHGKKELTGAA